MAEKGPLMIVALHSELHPDAVDDYVLAHRRIPTGLARTFHSLGIHDWTIWRSGRRLFHVVECDDWEAATASLDRDPANQEWQRHIGRYVEVFRDPEGEPAVAPLALVWRFATEGASDDA